MNTFDFPLLSDEKLSLAFKTIKLNTFQSAAYYLRSSTSIDNFLNLVVDDSSQSMTKTSKTHAVLATLAVENQIDEVELMMGIFLIDELTFPELKNYFSDKNYKTIALTTSYLNINGNRFDFSTDASILDRIANKIVREQRMDPHQSKEWKEKIYEDYIQKWLKRNPTIAYSLAQILNDEKNIIELLYNR